MPNWMGKADSRDPLLANISQRKHLLNLVLPIKPLKLNRTHSARINQHTIMIIRNRKSNFLHIALNDLIFLHVFALIKVIINKAFLI